MGGEKLYTPTWICQYVILLVALVAYLILVFYLNTFHFFNTEEEAKNSFAYILTTPIPDGLASPTEIRFTAAHYVVGSVLYWLVNLVHIVPIVIFVLFWVVSSETFDLPFLILAVAIASATALLFAIVNFLFTGWPLNAILTSVTGYCDPCNACAFCTTYKLSGTISPASEYTAFWSLVLIIAALMVLTSVMACVRSCVEKKRRSSAASSSSSSEPSEEVAASTQTSDDDISATSAALTAQPPATTQGRFRSNRKFD